MSDTIDSQLTRIETAKDYIADAITNKGVTVPSTAKIDDMPDYISQIVTGITPSGNIELQQKTGTNVTNYATASVVGATYGASMSFTPTINVVPGSNNKLYLNIANVTSKSPITTSGWIDTTAGITVIENSHDTLDINPYVYKSGISDYFTTSTADVSDVTLAGIAQVTPESTERLSEFVGSFEYYKIKPAVMETSMSIAPTIAFSTTGNMLNVSAMGSKSVYPVATAGWATDLSGSTITASSSTQVPVTPSFSGSNVSAYFNSGTESDYSISLAGSTSIQTGASEYQTFTGDSTYFKIKAGALKTSVAVSPTISPSTSGGWSLSISSALTTSINPVNTTGWLTTSDAMSVSGGNTQSYGVNITPTLGSESTYFTTGTSSDYNSYIMVSGNLTPQGSTSPLVYFSDPMPRKFLKIKQGEPVTTASATVTNWYEVVNNESLYVHTSSVASFNPISVTGWIKTTDGWTTAVEGGVNEQLKLKPYYASGITVGITTRQSLDEFFEVPSSTIYTPDLTMRSYVEVRDSGDGLIGTVTQSDESYVVKKPTLTSTTTKPSGTNYFTVTPTSSTQYIKPSAAGWMTTSDYIQVDPAELPTTFYLENEDSGIGECESQGQFVVNQNQILKLTQSQQNLRVNIGNRTIAIDMFDNAPTAYQNWTTTTAPYIYPTYASTSTYNTSVTHYGWKTKSQTVGGSSRESWGYITLPSGSHLMYEDGYSVPTNTLFYLGRMMQSYSTSATGAQTYVNSAIFGVYDKTNNRLYICSSSANTLYFFNTATYYYYVEFSRKLLVGCDSTASFSFAANATYNNTQTRYRTVRMTYSTTSVNVGTLNYKTPWYSHWGYCYRLNAIGFYGNSSGLYGTVGSTALTKGNVA